MYDRGCCGFSSPAGCEADRLYSAGQGAQAADGTLAKHLGGCPPRCCAYAEPVFWDINVRVSGMLGLVRAAGIGVVPDDAIKFLQWKRVATILLTILAMSVAAEIPVTRIRARLLRVDSVQPQPHRIASFYRWRGRNLSEDLAIPVREI